jgi:NTP pyrophosphatase (non-canonical NTP hydrolase)
MTDQNITPFEYVAFREGWGLMTDVVHATHIEKGWTKNSDPKSPVWQGNQIALMHGELSEAHEAIRKDLNDDKLTHRKGIEVELADVIIRIMNFARECNLDVPGALIEKAEFNRGRPFMHGDKKF